MDGLMLQMQLRHVYRQDQYILKQVHQIENEADKNLHEIINYLIKDFLPPIEREDIITLSHRIDDVIDCIDLQFFRKLFWCMRECGILCWRSNIKKHIIYNKCVAMKELKNNHSVGQKAEWLFFYCIGKINFFAFSLRVSKR